MKFPPIHYHDYLSLDRILQSNRPKSDEYGAPAHDEKLFITVHQVYEMWFQQTLFELRKVQTLFNQVPMPENSPSLISHALDRVHMIFQHSLGIIDILETMTPMDFLDFRDYLFPASGFQSFQFRQIETILGLRLENRHPYQNDLFYKTLKPEQQKDMEALMGAPSLFDQLEAWLTRLPFMDSGDFHFWTEYKKQVIEMIERDSHILRQNTRLTDAEREKALGMFAASRQQFDALFDEDKFKALQKQGYFRMNQKAILGALFVLTYRDQLVMNHPFQILNILQSIDETLAQWRYRHALMAYRMLGRKVGTGGSGGHDYLRESTEKHKVFADLFNLSTFLLPKSLTPPLPESVRKKLSF